MESIFYPIKTHSLPNKYIRVSGPCYYTSHFKNFSEQKKKYYLKHEDLIKISKDKSAIGKPILYEHDENQKIGTITSFDYNENTQIAYISGNINRKYSELLENKIKKKYFSISYYITLTDEKQISEKLFKEVSVTDNPELENTKIHIQFSKTMSSEIVNNGTDANQNTQEKVEISEKVSSNNGSEQEKSTKEQYFSVLKTLKSENTGELKKNISTAPENAKNEIIEHLLEYVALKNDSQSDLNEWLQHKDLKLQKYKSELKSRNMSEDTIDGLCKSLSLPKLKEVIQSYKVKSDSNSKNTSNNSNSNSKNLSKNSLDSDINSLSIMSNGLNYLSPSNKTTAMVHSKSSPSGYDFLKPNNPLGKRTQESFVQELPFEKRPRIDVDVMFSNTIPQF